MTDDNQTPATIDNDGADSCCSSSSCCAPQTPVVRAAPKIGRNDPCPCGNGKKYKKCCGRDV